MNNLVTISENDYKLRFPNNDPFNIEEMDIGTRTYYLKIYSLYMKLFEEFLVKNTNIKQYDTLLNDSHLNFVKTDNSNQDFYQYLSKDNFNYFYIRNNLYLYRLSSDEMDFLKNVLISNNDIFSDEINKFIKNTYQKVIFESKNDDSELITINFGPESPTFFAPNNALVIGVRYDEFNLNGQTDEEWDKNHLNQENYLYQLIEKFQKELQTQLNCDVKIIKYDDYSVKKKLNLNDTNYIKK